MAFSLKHLRKKRLDWSRCFPCIAVNFDVLVRSGREGQHETGDTGIRNAIARGLQKSVTQSKKYIL